MIHFSHDPEAGTLYCYFTELEAGQVVEELEYPASLLLDVAGQIIGLRVDLDDEITLDQIDLALEYEHAWLDPDTGRLAISISAEEAAQIVSLDDTAFLDLDDDGRVLGIELAVPDSLRTPERLARLEPHLIALEEAVAITDGDRPAILTAPPAMAEDQPEPIDSPAQAIRVGFVALVGKPNVGKSTLLNALLGQKIAIVSPRPQTTRVPLRGILTRSDAQIIFVDTPGIHEPRHKLGQFMVDVARASIRAADLIGFMVDISTPPSRLDERIAAQVQRSRVPKILILNKVDAQPRGAPHLEEYHALGPWDMEIAIAAIKGEGLSTLLDEIVQRLPLGEPLYPQDQVADQTEQHLAAELVREKVLRFTEQEVPHSVAVEVEEWEQKETATYIRMSVNVEKESQKGIVIGAGGAMLKRIGSAARQDIEKMLDRTIYLDLWVKVRPHWRDNLASLGWLGYRVKDWK
ncbi:MAG: GTPase Era [Chloroflexales bacterium]|nr:GTPase Era [Chloroflexales bacterium]